MDNEDFKDWWNLHVRASKGEQLTEAERKAYDEGMRLLRTEGVGEISLAALRQARDEIRELDAERDRLQERRRELRERAKMLESALSANAKHALGVGD